MKRAGILLKRALADRVIKALKPAADGKQYIVLDTVLPKFGVRVTRTGFRSHVQVTRFPGSRNPTPRALGPCAEIKTKQAREKARNWLDLISQGKDPVEEEKRAADEAARRRANTLARVIEDYIDKEAIGPDPERPKQRRSHHIARELRRTIVPLWVNGRSPTSPAPTCRA